jgi:Bifunctional DNA primase/polymerase, N-terminal
VTALLEAALRYASAGWPVFPCNPDGTPAPDEKAPLTRHGFKDASTDPPLIRGWWTRWPDANVAIATGLPGPDVLDVDKHDDGDGFAAFGRLKRAGLLTGAGALVRTRSGGLHAYYTGTSQPSARLPALHLDFKAAGGYVIAPPSRVLGRGYELLGHRGATAALSWQSVRALLAPPEPPRGNGKASPGGLAAWVAALPERNRNNGLYWAARRAIAEGTDPEVLLPAALAAGLPETEARRTITSAARRAGA